MVHGGGDHVSAGVPVSGHGAGEIDKVHQPAAKQVAQDVGVVRQNDLSHLGLSAGHGAGNRVARTGRVGFGVELMVRSLHMPFAGIAGLAGRAGLSKMADRPIEWNQAGGLARPSLPVSAIAANYANPQGWRRAEWTRSRD